MEALADSFLIFGRASLGATIGLAIGWPTQGERHVRYVIAWVVFGYAIGTALMWPHGWAMFATTLIAIPSVIGFVLGMGVGASTLGTKEDWWIRTWGFIGFLVAFHILAFVSSVFYVMAK